LSLLALHTQDTLALVLGAETITRIKHQQQRIDALQAEAAALAIRAQELNQEINARFQHRDALLQHYGQLF
jgi:Tfp pilus assembly protein PilN